MNLLRSIEAAHGGFQVAMLVETVRTHFNTALQSYDQPHSFNIHTVFLRAAEAGTAQVAVKQKKMGSGVSTVLATLCQGGKEVIKAFVSWVTFAAVCEQGTNHDASSMQQYKYAGRTRRQLRHEIPAHACSKSCGYCFARQ